LKKRGNIIVLALWTLVSVHARAQTGDALIRKGNRYYKQNQLDRSLELYQKALQESPSSAAASYNLGNVEFRKNKFDDAAKSYEVSVENSQDKQIQEKGLYNKGVALIKQQKLEESIEAWKNSLKLNPADEEARDNLEKALEELRKKQPPPPDKKNDKQKKPQEQKQNDQQQPKPQPSRLSKQQVDQLLNALQQKEKDLQDKMNRNNTHSLNQPDKDW
jgi:Ca-activated chloride channel homolog